MKNLLQVLVVVGLVVLTACGDGKSEESSGERRRPGMGGPGAWGGMEQGSSAAVPVEVMAVIRRDIGQNLQSHGSLEAENEVDLVARTTGPIVELVSEEGDRVVADQLLARIDDREARNQVAIADVNRDEAQRALERARRTFDSGLVSQETYDAARSSLESAEAQLNTAELQLDYTFIRAPFDALVINRHVKLAQYVSAGSTLFRVSDFDPLLCPIEVPERQLPRLRIGQVAHIEVDAFSGERFSARVLRIRPTVDATTGTVTVTLEVSAQGRLRPGMFATVFLEVDRRTDVVVIPRDTLVLDAMGDTVFVVVDGVAERRPVKLGFRDSGSVEVLEGVFEGEQLVVLGQDGLADGTPVEILERSTVAATSPPLSVASSASEAADPAPKVATGAPTEPRAEDGDRLEGREPRRPQRGEGRPHGREGARPGRENGDGEIPPFMIEKIKNASPHELDRIKQRLRGFGMSEERIDEAVRKALGEEKGE